MGIRKFLTIIIAIQAAIVILILLAALGLDVPGIRQLVGFIYLTFIPGLIILRILRIRDLGVVETLLYSAGLSITFVMFLGFFMNLAYPYIGIPRPISILPLTVTSTVVVFILCIVAYIRERRETVLQTEQKSIIWTEIVSPPVLFLLLLPLLSVLGSYYLFNFYQNTALSLVFILFVAAVAILIGFDIFIPRKLYPLAVMIIAVSLLWHWSLVSQHIAGFDIHHEYYYQNLVITNSFWDSTLSSNVNSMLSVVMLSPTYSLLLNMDSVWVFKIIYPVFFSLLPLALFQIFRKQTDDRVAFFSVFFFMSFSEFYMGMPQLGRQEVAELFFTLFVLLLLASPMSAARKRLLLVAFGFSIVVSHYGLSYIVLSYLVLAFLLVLLMRSRTLSGLWEGLIARLSRGKSSVGKEDSVTSPTGASPANPLSATIILTLTVFYFIWYMFIGSGSQLISIVNVGTSTYRTLGDLFVISAREPAVLMAVGLTSPEIASVPRNIFLVIQYGIQFFIVAGVVGLLFNWRKSRFQPVYIAMTMVSCLLLLLCIILPHFSKNFNMDRIYHVTLLFLAPFCILGGVTIFRWLSRLIPAKFSRAPTNPVYLKLVVILVLVPYFLFYSSIIYIFTGDPVTSIALNPEMDYPRYNEQEVIGKEWLLSNMATDYRIAVDWYGLRWLVEPYLRQYIFWGDTKRIADDVYIFLRSINVKERIVKKSMEKLNTYVDLPSSEFGKAVLAQRSRIYSNGGAQIYR